MNKSQTIIKLIEEMIHDIYPHETEEHLTKTAFKHHNDDEYSDHGSAIKYYNDDNHKQINSHLRHGTHVDTETKDHIDNLKEVTNHPAGKSFHAYRTRRDAAPEEHNEGDIIHDKGFTSTSLRPRGAITFSNHANPSKNTHYRIHVTPSTKGHYISAHDQSHDLEYKDEHEFLLHPGTKFKVLGQHAEHEYGGHTHKFIDLAIHHQDD